MGCVSKKNIKNCFCKAGISAHYQESVKDENYDPFKDILCIDDDPIGELKFDLKQLLEINPELPHANLNANEFVDIDADIATNNSEPPTVEEIVNDLNNETQAESGEAND